MTKVVCSDPPVAQPVLEQDGRIASGWRQFFTQLWRRTGGQSDFIDRILNDGLFVGTARRVNAGAGLQGGGDLSADVAIRLYVAIGPKAGLPTTGISSGAWAFCTNARNSGEGAGAGTGCPVYWYAAGSIWRIPGQAGAVAV